MPSPPLSERVVVTRYGSATSPTASTAEPARLSPAQRLDLLGVCASTAAALTVLALASYESRAPEANWIGWFGWGVGDILLRSFGVAGWWVPLELGLLARRLFTARQLPLGRWRALLVAIPLLVGCVLLHLTMPESIRYHLPASGAVGDVAGSALRIAFGRAGTVALCLSTLVLALIARGWLSLDKLVAGNGDDEGEYLPAVVVPERNRIAAPSKPALALPAPTPKSRPAVTIIVPAASRKGARVRTNGRGLPSTTLLAQAEASSMPIDRRQIQQTANALLDELETHGVLGRVHEVFPGPIVTTYEFEPQSGAKLSRVAGLADDLALGLAAEKVRIVAPIPGKSRIGFELPNPQRQTVYMRELLEDARWEGHQGTLTIAIGKDISGRPVYEDLTEMPHLLVAGATGAGKSVALNVMITSLLYRYRPDHVRLLLIDPKMVEFAPFQGIPHMLLPLVTDMNEAARALTWTVGEMERRYLLLAAAGCRNVAGYNERIARVQRGELPLEVLRTGETESPQDEPELLPYVVVVVDEVADMLMVAGKEVEGSIARLAQKARAAGIHLILATQRPSVDVITGVIKANFPARVAFKVSQREDSKTILGRQGAEHLLGNGDMLMIPPGSMDLKRVHCAYISEDEVTAVCDFLRTTGAPVYADLTQSDAPSTPAAAAHDELYERALQVIDEAGYCSVSYLQRQLGIGYNKAAKLVERMEREGHANTRRSAGRPKGRGTQSPPALRAV